MLLRSFKMSKLYLIPKNNVTTAMLSGDLYGLGGSSKTFFYLPLFITLLCAQYLE